MIQAKRECAAKKETPNIAHHDAEHEGEPIHPSTIPAEDEGTKKVAMEILESGICLQKEVSVEHAECEDDCEGSAEAVRPLQRRVGGETEKRHKRWGRKKN